MSATTATLARPAARLHPVEGTTASARWVRDGQRLAVELVLQDGGTRRLDLVALEQERGESPSGLAARVLRAVTGSTR